jgi:hypothetical protein
VILFLFHRLASHFAVAKLRVDHHTTGTTPAKPAGLRWRGSEPGALSVSTGGVLICDEETEAPLMRTWQKDCGLPGKAVFKFHRERNTAILAIGFRRERD